MKTQLEKIRKIDPKAAEYIENEVIPRYGGIDDLKPGNDLLYHFIWSETPQKQPYWLKIWSKLNGIPTH